MVRLGPLTGLSLLHGLSIEMAEAFAEYLHKRISGELGFCRRGGAGPRGDARPRLSR
jgi:cobalamin-dependent methionine synthase I